MVVWSFSGINNKTRPFFSCFRQDLFAKFCCQRHQHETKYRVLVNIFSKLAMDAYVARGSNFKWFCHQNHKNRLVPSSSMQNSSLMIEHVFMKTKIKCQIMFLIQSAILTLFLHSVRFF